MKSRQAAKTNDNQVKAATVHNEKLKQKLSLDFAVALKDVSIETIAGDKYCVIVRRGVNKACEGAIQYLEGNFSLSDGQHIKIKREQLSAQVVRYLIPYSDATKYPIYADTDESISVRNHYIFLNDCFSQLLSQHLPTQDYEFKGTKLTIKKQKNALPFLQPLFNSQLFKDCVEENGGNTIIHFDEGKRKKSMVCFSYSDLGKLFKSLSSNDKPIEWKHFPISYLTERFNHLLPVNNGTAAFMLGEDTGIENLYGPVIRIPLNSTTAQVLRTHLYLLEKFEFVDDKTAIYMRPEVARKMFYTVNTDPYEFLFLTFLAEQKKVAKRICDTGILTLSYLKKHIVIFYKNKDDVDFLGAFFANTLTPTSIDLSVMMLTRYVKLKYMFDAYENLFSTELQTDKLVIRSTCGAKLSALPKIGAIDASKPNGGIVYNIQMYALLKVKEEELTAVQEELNLIAQRMNLKNQLSAELVDSLKIKKINITVNDTQVVIQMPCAEYVVIAQPLFKALAIAPNTNACEWNTNIDDIRAFMNRDSRAIFDEIKKRQYLVSYFNIVKNVLGEPFVKAIQLALKTEKDITIDEDFFALGLAALQNIRQSVEAALDQQQKAHDAKKEAELLAKAQAIKPSLEDKPVRPVMQHKGAKNAAQVHQVLAKKSEKPKTKPQPKTKAAPNVTSQSSLVSKQSPHASQPSVLPQPAQRYAEVRDTASFYDYDRTKPIPPANAETPQQQTNLFGLFSKDEVTCAYNTIKKAIASIAFRTEQFNEEYEEICRLINVEQTDWQALMNCGKPYLCLSLFMVQDSIEVLAHLHQEIQAKHMQREFNEATLAFLQACEARMGNETLLNLHELAIWSLKLTPEVIRLKG